MFATRSAALDPRHLRMLRDILHFNKNGHRVALDNPGLSIGGLLEQLGHRHLGFVSGISLPFSGGDPGQRRPQKSSISLPTRDDGVLSATMALLSANGQHQWHTVRRAALLNMWRRLTAFLGVALASTCGSGTPVEKRNARGRWPCRSQSRRTGQRPSVLTRLIFATPFRNPNHGWGFFFCWTPSTRNRKGRSAVRAWGCEGTFRLTKNDAVLHCDADFMPKRRKHMVKLALN